MRARLVFVLLLATPASALGQVGILLRFHPAVGARLQFVSETSLTSVLIGFPSYPDSTPLESSWRTVVTQHVTGEQGNTKTLTARLDSSRARARAGSTARSDVIMPGAEGLNGRWVVSELAATASLTGTNGDSAFIDALTATSAGLRFGLPDGPVPVGGQWTGPFSFPLGSHLSASGKLASGGSIGGRATAVLDSIRPRGTDTLAFITLRGVASPTTLRVAAEGGNGTGTFGGGFAAGMIWSTGWNAFVSSSLSGLVTGTLAITRPEGPMNGAMTITIAGKQQVRL